MYRYVYIRIYVSVYLHVFGKASTKKLEEYRSYLDAVPLLPGAEEVDKELQNIK